jgi:hypothetical protein
MIENFLQLFRRPRRDETILTKMKPFSTFGANGTKPAMVIKPPTITGDCGQIHPRRSSMHMLSLILAFGFLLAGSSLVGSADSGMPGVGTFAYSGSPIAGKASQPIMLARL